MQKEFLKTEKRRYLNDNSYSKKWVNRRSRKRKDRNSKNNYIFENQASNRTLSHPKAYYGAIRSESRNQY